MYCFLHLSQESFKRSLAQKGKRSRVRRPTRSTSLPNWIVVWFAYETLDSTHCCFEMFLMFSKKMMFDTSLCLTGPSTLGRISLILSVSHLFKVPFLCFIIIFFFFNGLWTLYLCPQNWQVKIKKKEEEKKRCWYGQARPNAYEHAYGDDHTTVLGCVYLHLSIFCLFGKPQTILHSLAECWWYFF